MPIHYMTERLPEEVQLLLLYFLTVLDAQHCDDILALNQGGVYWGEKAGDHFPHLHKALRCAGHSGRALFDACYQQAYHALSPRLCVYFSLVKEGDVLGLDQARMRRKDAQFPLQLLLTTTTNETCLFTVGHSMNLLAWARHNGHQSILNYFFGLIIRGEMQGRADKEDGLQGSQYITSMNVLHWAVLCRQTHYIKKVLRPHSGLYVHTFLRAPISRIGLTPLHLAVRVPCLPIVKVLLDYDVTLMTLPDVWGWPSLFWACSEGDVAIVNDLLARYRRNPQLRATLRSYAVAPLQHAASHGRAAVIAVLLKWGIDPSMAVDEQDTTVLHIVAKRGSMRMARILIQHDASLLLQETIFGETPFLWACYFGHVALATYLLSQAEQCIDQPTRQHGSDMDGKTPLYWAVEKARVAVVQWLLNGKHKGSPNARVSAGRDGYQPLHQAVKSGNLPITKALVAYDPHTLLEKNHFGQIAFLLACAQGHIALVQYLLIQAHRWSRSCSEWCLRQPSYYAGHAMDQATPLAWAIYNGHTAVVLWLLLKTHPWQVDVKMRFGQWGLQALQLAVKKQSAPMAKAIIDYDPDTIFQSDKKYQYRYTPFFYACCNNQVALAKYILLRAWEWDPRRAASLIELDWVVRSGKSEILAFLLDKTAPWARYVKRRMQSMGHALIWETRGAGWDAAITPLLVRYLLAQAWQRHPQSTARLFGHLACVVALKPHEKWALMPCKLRIFVRFCLATPSLFTRFLQAHNNQPGVVNSLLDKEAQWAYHVKKTRKFPIDVQQRHALYIVITCARMPIIVVCALLDDTLSALFMQISGHVLYHYGGACSRKQAWLARVMQYMHRIRICAPQQLSVREKCEKLRSVQYVSYWVSTWIERVHALWHLVGRMRWVKQEESQHDVYKKTGRMAARDRQVETDLQPRFSSMSVGVGSGYGLPCQQHSDVEDGRTTLGGRFSQLGLNGCVVSTLCLPLALYYNEAGCEEAEPCVGVSP